MSNALDAPERVPKILPEHLPQGQLSIAVFGPGDGEAIVVRLPDGRVGVVDGCRSDRNPVLELVDALAPPRLAFVCLTHPHKDHFQGLDGVLERYRGRVDAVWEAGAIIANNYTAWVEWSRIAWGRRGSRSEEATASLERLRDPLERIYVEMGNLARENSNGYSALRARARLIQRDLYGGAEQEVWAWGPRDADVLAANTALLEWLRAKKRQGDAQPTTDPNEASGALLLRWGDSRILLAGDLYRESWSAVHQELLSTERVQVVNVAHHASENAHDDVLWQKMKPELAIVTPFKRASGAQPPRPGDIARLKKSCKVAITSPPAWLEENDPTHPKPVSSIVTPKVGLKSASTIKVDARSEEDRYNAVAVSMDARGTIVRVVCARHARFYV